MLFVGVPELVLFCPPGINCVNPGRVLVVSWFGEGRCDSVPSRCQVDQTWKGFCQLKVVSCLMQDLTTITQDLTTIMQ